MMTRRRRSSRPKCRAWITILAASAALLACSSATDTAARANEEAQAALSANDLVGARDALLRATQVRDDVADYWKALGETQAALRQLPDAYYAYSRAVELDRTDVRTLQALSEVALLTGHADEAIRYADQLELLVPDTLSAPTVRGYVALKQGRYDEALRQAATVLSRNPDDPNGIILKARALDGTGESARAAAMLEDLLKTQRTNQGALASLLYIYQGQEDRVGVMRTRARMAALEPGNPEAALAYARSLYEAGHGEEARALTRQLAGTDLPPPLLAELLKLWLRHAPPNIGIGDAEMLARELTAPDQRLELARFFVAAGAPANARSLLEPAARQPVTSRNANGVAVYAQALDQEGRSEEAKTLFDAVLAFDPTNVLALRGRGDLYLDEGQLERALADIRRLTAEAPSSPEDRLRLADIYLKKGQVQLAEKTYWDAFNDIKADPLLYTRLKAFLAKQGSSDALATLDRRYRQQKIELARAED